MKRMLLGGLIIILAFLFWGIVPRDAAAIPAFARKYKTSCMTCHAPFPTLTAVGEAFRLNGYRLWVQSSLLVLIKRILPTPWVTTTIRSRFSGSLPIQNAESPS